MTIASSKISILKQAGYKYHFDRGIYYNIKSKKIFSEVAVDDNGEKWLKDNITENNNNEWRCYFNIEPDKVKINEILKDILK